MINILIDSLSETLSSLPVKRLLYSQKSHFKNFKNNILLENKHGICYITFCFCAPSDIPTV